MTLTRDALTDVAAIAAAAPDSRLRLATAHGSVIAVGDHPAGAMCVDGFRRMMAAWVDGCEPHVETVDFEGAVFAGGMLAGDGARFFATRLTAEQTVECLRARADWPEDAHATVRQDGLLGVAVVQVFSDELDDAALEDAARDAQAACLVEELLGALPAA